MNVFCAFFCVFQKKVVTLQSLSLEDCRLIVLSSLLSGSENRYAQRRVLQNRLRMP